MKDLIKALKIFVKYAPDEKYPTWCENDILHVCVDPYTVSEEDKATLEVLGFYADDEDFYSYKYGSC